MTILVTGAAGFVGQAVAARLRERASDEPVRLIDRLAPPPIDDPRFSCLSANLLEPGVVERVLEGVTTVIHLASVPGAAAEADPVAARRVNIDATLDMLERIDAGQKQVRFVYASSVAVFGTLPAAVDDETPLSPRLVYGAQKQMMEIALADFHRRGRVRGIALRLPGIVARPAGASGLKSAFMSDIFHAARDAAPYVIPVSAEATAWMMSASCIADNLVHAASLDDLRGQALTLPAVRVRIGDLVNALGCSGSSNLRYAPDELLEAQFGSYPPLLAPAAHALGFCDDGDLAGLVNSVMRDLAGTL